MGIAQWQQAIAWESRNGTGVWPRESHVRSGSSTAIVSEPRSESAAPPTWNTPSCLPRISFEYLPCHAHHSPCDRSHKRNSAEEALVRVPWLLGNGGRTS